MAHVEATIADVRLILPASTQLTDPQIQAAIDTAHCMIVELELCCTYTSERLTKIETYLAAHFAAGTENSLTITSENDGCSDSSVSYGFKFGEGIKGTPFGQAANSLSGGCLAEFDKQPVNIFSIGSH